MKQFFQKTSYVLLVLALMAPVSLLAQKDKDKEEKDTKDSEQIIIMRKDGSDGKVVIELDGDKVTVNGKPVDKDGDITVHRNKIKDVWAFGGDGLAGSWNDYLGRTVATDENRAMLGVTTEKDSKGAEIQTISKESGAEKAGLKKGDIITKIDDKKIEGPDDLSAAIKQHKPGDKITVTYLRDGKEQKSSTELGKWKGLKQSVRVAVPNNYKMEFPNMNFDNLPRIQSIPRVQGQNWSWSGGGPKLGLFVQDAEDGKGVKVIEVDEDGNAGKAGIKEDDVITEIDGKTVNSADDAAKVIKESKDKVSVKVKLQRQGKSQDIDVKIPRKLKTADL